MNTPPKIADELPPDRMMKYPLCIRENICCFFEVPRNLTKREVGRIVQYLMALTNEESP